MRAQPDDSSLRSLARSLGLTTSRTDLLRQAVTHSSFAEENPSLGPDNERLEFLGDAVLKLVASDELMRRFPDCSEGRLSKMRAYVVSRKALAQAAQAIGLAPLLLLGKGAEKTGERNRDSVLADALEAVFGAVYLESGLLECRRLIVKVLGTALDSAAKSPLSENYKETLQEHLQKNGAPGPEYTVQDAPGHDGGQSFVAFVSHQGRVLGTGTGSSKKAATQLAAKAALVRLGVIDEDVHTES